jgi:hypothetical protein
MERRTCFSFVSFFKYCDMRIMQYSISENDRVCVCVCVYVCMYVCMYKESKAILVTGSGGP